MTQLKAWVKVEPLDALPTLPFHSPSPVFYHSVDLHPLGLGRLSASTLVWSIYLLVIGYETWWLLGEEEQGLYKLNGNNSYTLMTWLTFSIFYLYAFHHHFKFQFQHRILGSNKWRRIQPKSHDGVLPASGYASALVQDKIFAFGGVLNQLGVNEHGQSVEQLTNQVSSRFVSLNSQPHSSINLAQTLIKLNFTQYWISLIN